jgi:hypothetical protein
MPKASIDLICMPHEVMLLVEWPSRVVYPPVRDATVRIWSDDWGGEAHSDASGVWRVDAIGPVRTTFLPCHQCTHRRRA